MFQAELESSLLWDRGGEATLLMKSADRLLENPLLLRGSRSFRLVERGPPRRAGTRLCSIYQLRRQPPLKTRSQT